MNITQLLSEWSSLTIGLTLLFFSIGNFMIWREEKKNKDLRNSMILCIIGITIGTSGFIH